MGKSGAVRMTASSCGGTRGDGNKQQISPQCSAALRWPRGVSPGLEVEDLLCQAAAALEQGPDLQGGQVGGHAVGSGGQGLPSQAQRRGAGGQEDVHRALRPPFPGLGDEQGSGAAPALRFLRHLQHKGGGSAAAAAPRTHVGTVVGSERAHAELSRHPEACNKASSSFVCIWGGSSTPRVPKWAGKTEPCQPPHSPHQCQAPALRPGAPVGHSPERPGPGHQELPGLRALCVVPSPDKHHLWLPSEAAAAAGSAWARCRG